MSLFLGEWVSETKAWCPVFFLAWPPYFACLCSGFLPFPPPLTSQKIYNAPTLSDETPPQGKIFMSYIKSYQVITHRWYSIYIYTYFQFILACSVWFCATHLPVTRRKPGGTSHGLLETSWQNASLEVGGDLGEDRVRPITMKKTCALHLMVGAKNIKEYMNTPFFLDVCCIGVCWLFLPDVLFWIDFFAFFCFFIGFVVSLSIQIVRLLWEQKHQARWVTATSSDIYYPIPNFSRWFIQMWWENEDFLSPLT